MDRAAIVILVEALRAAEAEAEAGSGAAGRVALRAVAAHLLDRFGGPGVGPLQDWLEQARRELPS